MSIEGVREQEDGCTGGGGGWWACWGGGQGSCCSRFQRVKMG